MTSDELIVERRGEALWLAINRPARRNALTNPLMERMHQEVLSASRDRTLRALVITGTGEKAFCAGADLSKGDTPFQFDFSEVNTAFANLLRGLRECPLPIVGRINGYCLAGGMGLFGICDIVVATENASFGLPEAKVGIFPMQVLAVLRDVIPKRKLYELCLTAAPITAAEALQWGIVNHVVPPEELDATVEKLVEALARVSPTAVRRGKYGMRTMESMTFEEMIAFAETQVGPMALTEDAREGREAFQQKRAPVWTGR